MIVDISKVPCIFINRDQDVDKRKNIENQLSKAGFDNVHRLPAVENEVGYIGLNESLILALQKFNPPFLILEDDAQLSNMTSMTKIELPVDAQALYLGTSNWALQGGVTSHFLRYKKSKVDGILRVRNMLSAHAILYVDEGFVEKTLEALKSNNNSNFQIPDVVITRLQNKFPVYALNVPFFTQGNFESSISDATKWTQQALTEYPRSFQLSKIAVPINMAALKLLLKRVGK